MGRGRIGLLGLGLVLAATAASAWADRGETAAERGRRNLLERCYIPAIWSRGAYDKLWTRWDATPEPPADYHRAVRAAYGLHEAPYPNHDLPMGLREAPRWLGKGLAVDCLVCHGGSIAGASVIGLGNASLDVQALFEDLLAVDRIAAPLPHAFCNVRGTSEAGTMSVYLMSLRHPDLTFRSQRLEMPLFADQCEDVPAWWLMKKKRSIYHTGGADRDSVRAIMQFMMGSLQGPAAFAQAEDDFADIRDYFLSLTPPRYPFPIDTAQARQGQELFARHCARCHGTHGPDATYPNKIIPLAEIGTDPRRFEGITPEFARYYNTSWFAQPEKRSGKAYPARQTAGYQAPPLDGIWATAPYFHNGSVPTLAQVLDSRSRPERFTRSFATGLEDYDAVRAGWKYREVPAGKGDLPPREQRKVYDTRLPGRSNRGHVYGDELSDAERLALLEYLKTL